MIIRPYFAGLRSIYIPPSCHSVLPLQFGSFGSTSRSFGSQWTCRTQPLFRSSPKSPTTAISTNIPSSNLKHRNLPHSFFYPSSKRAFTNGHTFFDSNPALNDVSTKTSTSSAEGEKVYIPNPRVYKWLFSCSVLVFGIIVVGGVTRLTESGLSITEWKPITGTLPPLTAQQWQEEFDKYKATPEFKLLNSSITLDGFKSIFYMEYSHRLLGRVIGLVYGIPLLYFLFSRKRKLPSKIMYTLSGLGFLLGFQGALGWYMVKSGLEVEDKAVPRVSQYRLAAHLSSALLLYAGLLGTAMNLRSDIIWAKGQSKALDRASNFMRSGKLARNFKAGVWSLFGLVFLTAVSGAFVAGLDAGLVYNEFPYMGGRLKPSNDELFALAYAKNADGSDLWWRNLLENPTTVQFDHRVLATTTYLSATALYLTSKLHKPLRSLLPPLTKRFVLGVFLAANVQVLLGITTLLYLVPVNLAATHQAGSVVLLSTIVGVLSSLRKPSRIARLWRETNFKRRHSYSTSESLAPPHVVLQTPRSVTRG